MDLAFSQLASYESFYANTSVSAASEQKRTEMRAAVLTALGLDKDIAQMKPVRQAFDLLAYTEVSSEVARARDYVVEIALQHSRTA